MYLKRLNISLSDLILNYFSYFRPSYYLQNLTKFLIYRSTYRNYPNIMINILRKKYPIDAVKRNGTHTLLHNVLEAQIFGRHHIYGEGHESIDYDITNDLVILSTYLFDRKKGKVTIHGGINNGDIRAIFVDNVYRYLPVKNKTVIDIGANIGDSAIYFALCGATKIICLEPFAKNYNLAKKNITVNNFSSYVTLLLAGCSGSRGEITIDADYKSGNSGIVKDFKRGIKVPLLTLGDILNENNLISDTSIVLKMDCEGCEYETILSTNENTLRKFSHIMIEYHYGYKNLKEKVEKCGFEVSVTRPSIYWYSSDQFHGKIKFAEGYLFAENNYIEPKI
jgi:FkbM family methyltransferase